MNTNADEEVKFIFERRSIRAYSPGDVSETTVETLLAAAMAAPSAEGKNLGGLSWSATGKLLAE